MKNEKDILRYFDNELSEDQKKALHQANDFEFYSKVAHYAEQLETPKINVEQALSEFKNRQVPKGKVKTLNFKTWYKVAAVLVIMLCCSYALFFNNEKLYTTTIAQTETLYLPDDSEVVLNASSNLAYNKKEWKDKRNLNLEGEAFFKVSKGQKFTVKTSAGSVEVLGTQFNVKQRSGYFEVQCYEGLVGVSHKNQLVKLQPGKTFRVIDGKVISVADFTGSTPSWLQNESSFVNVPLGQVIAELERQYDIHITAENIDVTQLYTGAFAHNDKNVALTAVTVPLKLSYKINGKNVIFYHYNGE